MLNAKVLKFLNLSPGKVASLALFDDVYSKHPEKIQSLLTKHGQKFTGDPATDFMQVSHLSGQPKPGSLGRGRFFTEDLEDVAKEAKYFSLGDFSQHLTFDTDQLANLAGSAAIAGATGGADIPADIATIKNLAGLATSIFGPKTKPVETKDVFGWPPESEFPKTAWNTLISNPAASKGDLEKALKYANDLVTDYKRQIGVHTAAGNGPAAANVTIWGNKAQEFVNAFTQKLATGTGTPPNIQTQLGNIFSQAQTDPNLDNRTDAQKLKDLMDKTAEDKPVKMIMGMKATYFYVGLSILIAAIVITIVILVVQHKKKKEQKKVAA